jgi:hypothetical protein
MDLVDDTAVNVSDKRVAPRVVFARRRIGLFGRHHQYVRALGLARVQVALAGDDVHRVAKFLEPFPLTFFLVCERPEWGEKECRSARSEGLGDCDLRDSSFAARGRRAHHDVFVGFYECRQRLGLHRIEPFEGKHVRECRQHVRHGGPGLAIGVS